MKTVNLDQILIEKCAERRWHLSIDFKADLIAAMREACNQTIALCAENAAMTFTKEDQNQNIAVSYLINSTKNQII